MDNLAWRDAQARKQKELVAAINVETLKHGKNGQKQLNNLINAEFIASFESFDVFEASLESICRDYTQRGISRLINEKLHPWFDHLQSFAAAISASTQANSYASLCWGALLIVIQCGCMFAESLQSILEQLEDLYEAMPLFSEHLALYPSNARLRLALRDIYEDFLDYNIQIIKFLRRSPLANFFRTFVPSSLRRQLTGTRKRLEKHIANFRDKADLAHRQKEESNHTETITLAKSTRETLLTLSHPNTHDEQKPPEFPLHTVNLRRNPAFTGREDILKSLHSKIAIVESSTEPISCTLYGIGGVGKTQTALEYTYEFRSHYDGIFWVRAETNIELLKCYGAIGRKLGLMSGADVDQPAVESIQRFLEETDRSMLIVFDNVNDWDSISTYWPTTSKGRISIIVTAQKEVDWTDTKICLDTLSPEVGSSLLLKQLGINDDGPDKDLAEEISQSVGGLPLWLNQVGGFIQFSKCSLSDYRDSHQSSSNLLGQKKIGENWRYERSITAVFDNAIQQLEDDTTDLLYLLTFLNPDETDEEMLLSDHASCELAFLCKNNKPRYLSMIRDLSLSQLVHREKSGERVYLTTHRSLQEGLMQKLNKDTTTRQKAFDRATLLLREHFPSPLRIQQAEAKKWPSIVLVLPHLLNLASAFKRAMPSMQGSLLFAELLADVGGMNLYDRGLVKEAQTLLRAAQSTLDSIQHPERSRLRGDISIVLGLLTDIVGISERLEGLELRKQAVQVREDCFSQIPPAEVSIEDEILLHNSYTDLACSYQQLNRFDEVEHFSEKCLEKYKSWGSEDEYPYEYAKYFHHMAFVHIFRKQTAKAVEYGKKAADLMALGAPGAQIATIYLFDWAVFLFQNGEIDYAFEEHKAIFDRRLRECGNLNILTIQSRLMLGIMSFCRNNLDEAESWLRQTLTLDRKVHWPHENVARAKYYLSQVLILKEEGASKEGTRLEQEAKMALEELLTPEQRNDIINQFNSESKLTDTVLFDYIVPWGYRVIVPQTGNGIVAAPLSQLPL